jgi:ferrous iron transport protein B
MITEVSESTMVALVGNPNSGKTTIFNALTGQNQKVGNYAGVTVSKKSGSFRTPDGRKMDLLDLPGCLSLTPISEDEKISASVLKGLQEGEKFPDVVVCVVDASSLERQLRLVLEVIELGHPTVLALNMVDMAESNGVRLDPTLLSEELGIPVVPMQANKGKGIIQLKQALRMPLPALSEQQWEATDEGRMGKIEVIVEAAARRSDSEHYSLTLSDKLDAWFLHPISGWLSFIAIMLAVFWSIFALSEAPMGVVEQVFGGLGNWVNSLMPEGDLRSLIVDGVIAGLGGTVIFLPQIIILFFFIGLMETTGYMSRAAYLMDGVMTKVGLSGRAFLPLLSSHACAIPGIMATRTIPSGRERFITILIAPWMSCSARIPVYTTLILLLLPGVSFLNKAFMMLGIYSVGIITAFIAAKILRTRIPADKEVSHFLLELPSYRAPQVGYLIRQISARAWSFIKRAGTVILGLSILLWALQTYPKPDEGSPAAEDSALALEQSFMGMAGKTVEPVMKPLGYDWRMGTAVIASFAAREVFISNLMITYSIEEDDDEDSMNQSLRDKLAASTWPDGRKIYTPLTLLSLLVFFIYALQCLPTTVVVMRELNSKKWAIYQLVGMSGFAYVAALSVFQIGKLLGFQ